MSYTDEILTGRAETEKTEEMLLFAKRCEEIKETHKSRVFDLVLTSTKKITYSVQWEDSRRRTDL